ncbi:hypothetical protein GH742_02030 [Legionella sp. MW5194]|uniref:hypothetical protein n=1 Tax=Legionella sp. MW5194 TaxID=2662448 RepID=UPI00193D8334|nr:hypothetical protein [Legionella sp. MW5194]QRN02750.1 hypothetical protein GH742_02030 [Legionella sp. MW5194]
MGYNVYEVNGYLNEAIRKLGGKPQLHKGKSWDAEKKDMNEKGKDYLTAKRQDLPPLRLRPLFVEYLIAISNAQQYVFEKKKHQSMRQGVLNIIIEAMLQEADNFPELADLTKPEVVLSQTKGALESSEQTEKRAAPPEQNPERISEERSKEVNGFFESNAEAEVDPKVAEFGMSKELEDLKSYQLFLINDPRTHACRVEKAETLNRLIQQLESQKTIEGIKGVLTEFYDGEGMVDKETKKDSAYEILNKGQGLTTRFLGFFNTNSHTTTLKLIDSLAKTVGVGHKNDHFKLS